MQSTVDAIREWFRECPEILKGNRFGIDNLASDPTQYAVFMSPSNLQSYVDVTGEMCLRSVQELNFVFASREKHTSDVLQALANHGFYDSVIKWIIAQNKNKNFPEIAEGTVISIMPSMTQYLYEAGTSTGRYQISCKLKYRRKT